MEEESGERRRRGVKVNEVCEWTRSKVEGRWSDVEEIRL